MTMTMTNYDYNFGCWLLAIGYQPLVTHLTSYILHLFLNCKITKHLHTFCDIRTKKLLTSYQQWRFAIYDLRLET